MNVRFDRLNIKVCFKKPLSYIKKSSIQVMNQEDKKYGHLDNKLYFLSKCQYFFVDNETNSYTELDF